MFFCLQCIHFHFTRPCLCCRSWRTTGGHGGRVEWRQLGNIHNLAIAILDLLFSNRFFLTIFNPILSNAIIFWVGVRILQGCGCRFRPVFSTVCWPMRWPMMIWNCLDLELLITMKHDTDSADFCLNDLNMFEWSFTSEVFQTFLDPMISSELFQFHNEIPGRGIILWPVMALRWAMPRTIQCPSWRRTSRPVRPRPRAPQCSWRAGRSLCDSNEIRSVISLYRYEIKMIQNEYEIDSHRQD